MFGKSVKDVASWISPLSRNCKSFPAIARRQKEKKSNRFSNSTASKKKRNYCSKGYAFSSFKVKAVA